MNAVLFDIFTCEQELASHGQVEDRLFVPAVYQLEKRLDATKVCEVKKPLVEEPEEDTEMTGSQLSQREKEVICCVVTLKCCGLFFTGLLPTQQLLWQS